MVYRENLVSTTKNLVMKKFKVKYQLEIMHDIFNMVVALNSNSNALRSNVSLSASCSHAFSCCCWKCGLLQAGWFRASGLPALALVMCFTSQMILSPGCSPVVIQITLTVVTKKFGLCDRPVWQGFKVQLAIQMTFPSDLTTREAKGHLNKTFLF